MEKKVKMIPNLLSLQNRTALITGAAGNLGAIFSETLASLGANLILVDLEASNLALLKNKISEKFDVKIETFVTDLENRKDRQKLIEAVNCDYQKLDILINNAAIVATDNLSGWTSEWESQSLDSWNRGLEVNLTSVFDLSKGLTKLLSTSENGTIINIGSLYGHLGPDWALYAGTGMGNSAAYSTSKGAIIQLTRWMGTTLSPKIRVNCLSPGGIFRDQDEVFHKRFKDKTPLGRMATEQDYVGPISFLASDMSAYMTGQNLIVDGGYSVM